MRACLCLALIAALAVPAAGCGEKVDLTTGLEVVEVSTGWHNAGVVDGQNKIVPSVTFRLKNVSGETLKSLQANAVFRRATDPPEEWGSGFVTVAKSEGLAAGATSQSITIHSPKGYTGSETPDEMLNNSRFVDAGTDVLAKYSSAQWQSVAKHPVERKLLNP